MSGASIINYRSTLVLYGIRTKHLSNNPDHVQSNTSRPIAGNDTPFENRLKPFYLRKDYLRLLQMFKSVKSDSASNLEDKWKLVYVLVYFTENIAMVLSFHSTHYLVSTYFFQFTLKAPKIYRYINLGI